MSKNKNRPHRRIAPRLANGQHRMPTVIGMPPALREAADLIAVARNESRSWALEQILTRAGTITKIMDEKRIDIPEYVPRKKNT